MGERGITDSGQQEKSKEVWKEKGRKVRGIGGWREEWDGVCVCARIDTTALNYHSTPSNVGSSANPGLPLCPLLFFFFLSVSLTPPAAHFSGRFVGL